jgi:hypothetical protein
VAPVNEITPLPDLQARAVESLRLYALGKGERTGHLRDVATAFVEARQHFFTKDGDPDWLGRTYTYRTWVGDTMTLANIPREDVSSLQASIRYHTGNVLRDGRLDEETLADLGLRSESPRERSLEKRSAHSATLSIFGGGGAAITDGDELLSALRMVEGALRRVDLVAVGALPAGKRTDIAGAAEAVYKPLKGIADAARKPKKVT